MKTLHVVMPDGVDDPLRPSGGNVYDRRVIDELAANGWEVVEHVASGEWPTPDPAALAALAALLREISNGSSVVVDGLVGSAAGEQLAAVADRLHLTLLVHMPLGTSPGPVRDSEAAALGAATSVVATSSWTRLQLLDNYPLDASDVHVATPGVDLAEPVVGSEIGNRLLCVGAVTPVKGQDRLLNALEQLLDLPWHCACVGSLERDANFADAVRRRAEISLSGRVDFTGPLVGEALAAQYAASDVLLLPSRSETYGMVINESLARAVPVIASDVGGVAEALGAIDGHGPGLLVAERDTRAFADAVRRWLVDPGLRNDLREAAAERRRSLPTWEQTRDVFAQVVAGVAVAR